MTEPIHRRVRREAVQQVAGGVERERNDYAVERAGQQVAFVDGDDQVVQGAVAVRVDGNVELRAGGVRPLVPAVDGEDEARIGVWDARVAERPELRLHADGPNAGDAGRVVLVGDAPGVDIGRGGVDAEVVELDAAGGDAGLDLERRRSADGHVRRAARDDQEGNVERVDARAGGDRSRGDDALD